jgi:hypothetical protein
MDRISALRNVEDALAAFEDGEVTLSALEERVAGVLRTYATEFDHDGRVVYRVHGCDRERPVVVVAPSPEAARDRARTTADCRPARVERLSDSGQSEN